VPTHDDLWMLAVTTLGWLFPEIATGLGQFLGVNRFGLLSFESMDLGAKWDSEALERS